MKTFFYGIVAAMGIAMLGGSAFIYSGAFDIAADSPHGELTYKIIQTTRDRAIDARAESVPTPLNLADSERVRRGSGNYDEMCANCHLKPGTSDSEIRKGLYPAPPDLSKKTEENQNSDATLKRQFWVIKHGIKASGMAAWGKGGMEDEAIWDMVAFLQKMPSMSSEEYQAIVKASDGHSHTGATHQNRMEKHHDNADGHHDTLKKDPEAITPDAHGSSDHGH